MTGHALDTDSPRFASLAEFMEWCKRAPTGTRLEAQAIVAVLASCADGESVPARRVELLRDAADGSAAPTWTWRERLWVAPAETRLGVAEVAEALGRPKSWVYAKTAKKEKGEERSPKDLLPHRKLDGSLVFTVGELRSWIRSHEEELVGGPMDSIPWERRLRLEPATR